MDLNRYKRYISKKTKVVNPPKDRGINLSASQVMLGNNPNDEIASDWNASITLLDYLNNSYNCQVLLS
jgi:hypothetical protein